MLLLLWLLPNHLQLLTHHKLIAFGVLLVYVKNSQWMQIFRNGNDKRWCFLSKKISCTGWLIWIIDRHIFYKLHFSLNPGSVMDSWLMGNDVSFSVSTDISWPIMIPNSTFWYLSQGQDQNFDLPLKNKSDICTIMYTSGTTGDPKGVIISNESIITLLAGVKRLLESVNEQVCTLLLNIRILHVNAQV